MMFRSALPLTLILLASGCAPTTGNAPSLLPRAIETRSDAEPLRPQPVAATDPALDAGIADRRAALDDAKRTFSRAANAAEASVAVARGLSAGSEPWITAQTALTELDRIQADTVAIVSDIEALAISRAAEGMAPYPALDALLAQAQTMVAAQGERIRGMSARLSDG